MVLALLASLDAAWGPRPRTRHTRVAAITSCRRVVESRGPSLVAQRRRLRARPPQTTALPRLQPRSMAALHARLEAPDRRTRAGSRARARLHVCGAAGRRARSRPLGTPTADDLPAWLAVRGAVGIPALGRPAPARVLTRAGCASVRRTDVRLAAHRGPARAQPQVSPQGWRHTWAMLIVHATGALRNVARWLGHAARPTPAIARRADPTDQLDAIAAVRPPARRRGHVTVPDHLIAA